MSIAYLFRTLISALRGLQSEDLFTELLQSRPFLRLQPLDGFSPGRELQRGFSRLDSWLSSQKSSGCGLCQLEIGGEQAGKYTRDDWFHFLAPFPHRVDPRIQIHHPLIC